MKKKVFAVGDRVGTMANVVEYDEEYGDYRPVDRYAHDEEPYYGKIVALNGDTATVCFDEVHRFYGASTQEIEIESLMSEADAKKAWNKLEKTFDAVQKEITTKLKAAGKLIKEANKLSNKCGMNLVDMYDARDPLYDALDASGWRTSSFNC